MARAQQALQQRIRWAVGLSIVIVGLGIAWWAILINQPEASGTPSVETSSSGICVTQKDTELIRDRNSFGSLFVNRKSNPNVDAILCNASTNTGSREGAITLSSRAKSLEAFAGVSKIDIQGLPLSEPHMFTVNIAPYSEDPSQYSQQNLIANLGTSAGQPIRVTLDSNATTQLGLTNNYYGYGTYYGFGNQNQLPGTTSYTRVIGYVFSGGTSVSATNVYASVAFNLKKNAATECNDGIDNDSDGLVDTNDPGCTGPTDPDESNPPAPTANDDTAETNEGTEVLIDVLANDKDNGGVIDRNGSITIIKEAQQGTAEVINVSSFGGTANVRTLRSYEVRYTPSAGFSGSDSFTYKVCNEVNLCDTAVVSITVKAKEAFTISITPTSGTVPVDATITGTQPICSVDFGDDAQESVNSSSTVQHTYEQAGNYTVQATACDDQPATAQISVTTQSTAKVELKMIKTVYQPGEKVEFYLANAGPSCVNLPNSAPFTISSEADPNVFTPTATQQLSELCADGRKDLYWDQKTNDSQQAEVGSYTVTAHYLLGNTEKAVSATFSIAEKQLTELNIDCVPNEGLAPLEVTCSYDGSENVTWDFDDGATGSGATVVHTYTEAGSYTITARTASGVGTAIVTVTAAGVTPNVDNTSGGDATAAPIENLAATGGGLALTLIASFVLAGLVSYFIIRRPFSKGE